MCLTVWTIFVLIKNGLKFDTHELYEGRSRTNRVEEVKHPKLSSTLRTIKNLQIHLLKAFRWFCLCSCMFNVACLTSPTRRIITFLFREKDLTAASIIKMEGNKTSITNMKVPHTPIVTHSHTGGQCPS